MTKRYLGIDFSGASAPWRERLSKPTIWIATADDTAAGLHLIDLRPVQALPGQGDAFSRLAHLLSRGDYLAAAIDAPFSIPIAHAPAGGHAALRDLVARLPSAEDRPFPLGGVLLSAAEQICPKSSPKPLRACERYWVDRSVNTRSTLWNGPRGGAPFAAACLTMIVRSGRPCWPWVPDSPGMLAEAFPAAQLRQWNLPHQGYSGTVGLEARKLIVKALAFRITLVSGQIDMMHACPDALDAVLAIFAAVAASNGLAPRPPDAGFEGWIAVHP